MLHLPLMDILGFSYPGKATAAARASLSIYMAGSSLTQIILGCLNWVQLQQLQEHHYPFIWLAVALPR